MEHARSKWLVLAGLWLATAMLFGAALATGGLFYHSISVAFHISRQAVSLISSLPSVGVCLGSLIAGGLLTFLDPKPVIIIGLALVGISFGTLAIAPSFPLLLLAYGAVGVGVGIGCVIPVSLIIRAWFGERAGFALGLTMTGAAFGAAAAVPFITYFITHYDWRVAEMALGVPFIFPVIPIVALLRSRPAQARVGTAPPIAERGMEVGAALRTREFWLVVIGQFSFGWIANSILGHLVSYLTSIGYGLNRAAAALSAVLLLTALGKVILGYLADWTGSRWAMATAFMGTAIGLSLLLNASRPAFLLPAIVVYGLCWGAPLALLPLLTMQSLGLKRFGAISGLTSIGFTLGSALGPLSAGRIFDRTHTYTAALGVNIAVALIVGMAVLACRPLYAPMVQQALPRSAA
ncbi:MAG TPA: MFS transporter [Candidatus Binataceae bacterium]|nr:MFS transporter [Candidatus Binataceae bacterium]